VLNPILANTNIVLDAYEVNKFTIGIYLDDYRKEPASYSEINIIGAETNMLSIDDWDPITDSGILVLRDDLNLASKFLSKELLQNTQRDEALEVASAIQKSFNNITFIKQNFQIQGTNHTIVCSDIPLVCSDSEATGVLFFIIEGTYSPVVDLPYVLRIFTRITSNYVYKYDECLLSQIVSKKQMPPPALS
jgi:hypothetical protein